MRAGGECVSFSLLDAPVPFWTCGRVRGTIGAGRDRGDSIVSNAGGRLTAGQFYGAVALRRTVAGLIVSETRYDADAAFPYHSHDLAYFSFLIAGTHVERIARTERGDRPFAAHFHPIGEEHSGHVRGGSRLFVLELGESWLARVPGREVLPGEGRVLPGIESVQLAARLFHEFHQGDPCSPLAIEGLACELLAAAARCHDRASRRPAWLTRVEELLHAETCGRLDLARVAGEAGVHPMHLTRVFRRHHGMSLGAFARRLKIEAACAALARPQESLADIACGLGFTDQSHFTRTFKAATGLTPGRFRGAVLGRRASFVQDARAATQ
jgi:AraC family transcriptional regulator